MENEELINEYIAQLAKSVNDLTLENLLLKSKQSQASKTAGNLVEQVQRQIQEIQELKAQQNSTDLEATTETQEYLDLKNKSDEAEDYIVRLEEGLEQANEFIAKFEEDKNAAVAKCELLENEIKELKEKSKQVKDTQKNSKEYQALYEQNIQLLKTVDFNEHKIAELKNKLQTCIKESATVN